MHLETRLAHGSRASDSVAPPIYQTSSFRADTGDDFARRAAEPRNPRFYTRYGNPTLREVETLLAELEGGEDALVTASGMGAISAAVLSNVRAGGHVVAQREIYSGVGELISGLLPRFGVDVTLVDQTDTGAFAAACNDRTTLIYLETPSNPLLRITDLRAIAAVARERNVRTIVDNTFATPLNQNPIACGIDIVVHSATKYLGGHSDLSAGAIVGTRAALEACWRTSIVTGAVLGPIDAWLLLRGMRTLALRVERQNANALALAEFLQHHPAVTAVNYPGLSTHPQHALARSQMRGFGGVLSFEVDGGSERVERVLGALQIPSRAASIGGFESLVVAVGAMWSGTLDDEALAALGVSPSLIRFAVGIENVEDLRSDLDRALRV